MNKKNLREAAITERESTIKYVLKHGDYTSKEKRRIEASLTRWGKWARWLNGYEG